MKVLYFTADWCMPCKAFRPIVERISKDLGVTVNYMNVEKEEASVKQHSISSVPTLIILGQDDSVQFRHSGAMSPKQLTETYNKFL